MGLKDSSGDMAYAREAAGDRQGLRRVPLDRGGLLEARSGRFAGCISATANSTPTLCQRAWCYGRSRPRSKQAVTIRKLFDGKPLVSGVKALLAHIHGDAAWARVTPPLGAVLRRRQGRHERRLRRRAGETGGVKEGLTPPAPPFISLPNRRRSLAAVLVFNT